MSSNFTINNYDKEKAKDEEKRGRNYKQFEMIKNQN